MDFDVVIIGGGVTGSAIAYELAKTDLKVALLEKEEDVCEGTSKANSAIVHAGFDALPGTLKAKLNVEGSKMMPELARLLDFEYKNNGALVLCFDEEHRKGVVELYERGQANGVEGLQILEKEQIKEMEPNISDDVVCALYAPTSSIVCPFGLTIALAENAADNGVKFYFNQLVETIEKIDGGWKINDKYTARTIVNAAGVYADEIHNGVSEKKIHITPRRGEYVLLDRSAGDLCSHTLFQLPTPAGKGVLITPTVHGNMMIGPNAQETETKENTNTTPEGQAEIRAKALKTISSIPFQKTIRTFSGLRATPDGGDFIIKESTDGFFDAAGIESPGLSSAPAIGKMVAGMVEDKLKPGKKENYKATRKGFVNVKNLTKEEWDKLIEQDPDYGTIVCRCETVTAGSIKDALHRSIPATSLDGIKRRTRAGMGRCQAGFCSPRSMEIISKELNIPMDEICQSGKGSKLITGKVKEGLNNGK